MERIWLAVAVEASSLIKDEDNLVLRVRISPVFTVDKFR
jgi:hypothetical protein